ncbi:MAG TPA: FtsQ-type POTRA domain-containing protein [Vicinamibacterales bacterium]|nr:FtsQ-type POTRA domain-containing protein [Vicinamibacterales bacterium]
MSRRGLPTATLRPPADRRFHRPDVIRRERRRRLARVAGRVLKWGVPIAAVTLVAVALVHAALRSPLFAVRQVTVNGNARLSAAAVERLAGDVRGQNIFAVDLAAARERVLTSPWVADVTLARVLPSTLVVDVVERVPMAIARVGDRLFLVDDAGVVIDAYGPAYRDLDLPLVDGLVAASGDRPAADAERASLSRALFTSLRDRPDLGRRVSEIDVSSDDDAVVLLDNDPTRLHLGDRAFVERLTRYLELAPTLADRFSAVDYVDLRFGDRVFVHSESKRRGRR